MNKKLDMVLGGVQLLVAIGVSTLVGDGHSIWALLRR